MAQAVPGGGTFALQVSGRDGVPAGAGAVAFTLTATQPTSAGDVRVYAHGAATPLASNLNFTAGSTVANLVIAQLSADGAVDLHVDGPGTVQLIADMAGYYLSGSPVDPGAFGPVEPSRVLDTRHGIGAAAMPVSAGTTVPVVVAGVAGIPATGVGSVAITVTTTQASAAGFVTAFADGAPLPATSNLNYVAGQTVADLVIAPVANGKVDLHVAGSGAVALIADVSGYFLSGTPAGSGAFGSTPPTRLLDTRHGIGTSSGVVSGGSLIAVQVAGQAGAPATGLTAVALTVTVTQPTAFGHVTALADGAGLPNASNLNFHPGQTVANLVFAPVAAGGRIDLSIAGTGTVQVIADIAGYVLGPPADTTPPGPVTALTVTATTETNASLSWQDPTAPDLAGLMIRRVPGSSAPAGPADGALVAVLPSTAISYTDSTVVPQNTYSYSVFSYDAVPNYSAATTSATTRSMTWHSTGVIDQFAGDPSAISCPTSTFCMSVDQSGQAIAAVNGVWQHPVRLIASTLTENGFTGISCVSSSYCVAVSLLGTAFVYQSGSWSSAYNVYPGHVLADVSCRSTTLCWATGGGPVFRWNGSTWSAPIALPGGKNVSDKVSCTSLAFCVVIGVTGSGNWAWQWTGSTWTGPVDVLSMGGDEIWSISCSGTKFCVGIADNGYFVRFDGTRWTAPARNGLVSSFEGHSISCTSATFCVAIGNDVARGSTSVRYNGSSWTSEIVVDGSAFAGAVSCVSTACTHIDGSGYSFRGDGVTWTGRDFYDTSQGWLLGLSCATATMCVAVDRWANYLVYNGTTWSAPKKIDNSVTTVGGPSCVAPSFCLVVASGGRAWTFDGIRWTQRATSPLSAPFVSCGSPSFCVAASYGAVSTFNGSTWTTPYQLDTYAQTVGLSCTRNGLCALSDFPSTNGVPNRLDLLSGGHWRGYTVAFSGSTSCVDPGYCLLAGPGGWIVYDNGTLRDLAASSNASMTCLARSFCLAWSSAGAQVFNGASLGTITSPLALDPGDQPTDISCSAPNACAATGFYSAAVGG